MTTSIFELPRVAVISNLSSSPAGITTSVDADGEGVGSASALGDVDGSTSVTIEEVSGSTSIAVRAS